MIDDKWKTFIKTTIEKHLPNKNYQICLFGSRAVGTNKKWSDVDVGISGPGNLSWSVLAKINTELDESKIPYRVDVVDFSRVFEKFAKIALEKVEYL